MQVLFDVTALQTPPSQVRGIGGYVRNLHSAMEGVSQVDILSLGFSQPVPGLEVSRPDVIIGPGPTRWPSLTAVSLALYPGSWPSGSIVHFTSLHALGAERFRRRPYVATVFDLIPLMWPREYLARPVSRRGYAEYIGHLRGAVRLLAISATVADDVADRLDIPRDRITVTPLGVPPLPRPGEISPRKSPYVFLAGTPDPHKNASFVIDAVSLIPSSLRPDVVMTGAGEGHAATMMLRARSLGVTLEHLGRVSSSELSTLYRHAAAVLVPSLYEGFGLQAIEALSVGARVAVSRGGALPEVVGDAALVLPFEMGLWADTVVCALSGDWPLDAGRGPEQARRFTWSRTAEATSAAYADI